MIVICHNTKLKLQEVSLSKIVDKSVSLTSLTAESQTYEMVCGEEGVEGSEVRVQVVDTKEPLMIAEIGVLGYKPISKF